MSPNPVVPPRAGRHYDQGDLNRILAGDSTEAVLVQTSGSTGTSRTVVISGAALIASGQATARFLGTHGQWLLALPTNHIAGIQVLARSVLAGYPTIAADLSNGFTPQAFLSAVDQFQNTVRLTSLVPTQLHRLLNAKDEHRARCIEALQTFEAILLGGAPATPYLLEQCAELHINIVTTYGMSETAGGCIYNGTPLDIARVRIDEHSALDSPGRILLAGPMLASGYLDQGEVVVPEGSFFEDSSGIMWHRTNDLGSLSASGVLSVLGRGDDIIISGGENVSPTQIEAVLTGKFGITQVCVVGIPDPVWGQRVVAVVAGDCAVSEIGPLNIIRRHVADILGRSSSPTQIFIVPSLPLLDSGKVDRLAVTRLATEQN